MLLGVDVGGTFTDAVLAREESRGVHRRADHAELDPALDLKHAVSRPQRAPSFERWE